MQNEDLRKLFEEFGEVTSAKIIKHFGSDRSRGFGFISMKSPDDANRALASLDKKIVGGQKLNVKVAYEKEKFRLNLW